MPTYGTPEAVKGLLDNETAPTFTTPQDARITELLKTVSILIEEETGAFFGVNAAETVVVSADGGTRLFLDKGIRTLTSITEHPDWVSGAWTGGTALTSSAYRLDSLSRTGAYRTIVRMDGGWLGTYVIAGVWEDQVPEPVPDDITYLANYLSAEIFKKQAASPAGFVGPDNAVVPVRNTFKEPEVRKILDKHRVGAGMWVV